MPFVYNFWPLHNFFAIYQGPGTVYPNPPGAWIPEDFPGGQGQDLQNVKARRNIEMQM